ncbi:MAG: hypothetical protein R3E08_01235 [Thiotrichaceae bacterium]
MDGQPGYQLLRQKSPSRRRFFEDIRVTLTSYLYFDVDVLMDFMSPKVLLS